MSFNYEQSIWGKGTASARWSDPTAFRLRMALHVIDEVQNAADTGKVRVLEVGCGGGQFIRAIQKYRPDTECYGCDISESAIAVAKSAGDAVKYAISDRRYPYEDNFFDVVLIFDVLEHVERPDEIVHEVRRVLKTGGLFYAFVPCEGDWTSLWYVLDKLGLKKDLTKKYAGHINYFTRRELTECVINPAPPEEAVREDKFNIQRLRYSEHILGQLLGVLAFHLMDRGAKRSGQAQINNEEYFSKQGGGVIAVIKKLINTLVYIESLLWQWIPSPNVHVVAKKIKVKIEKLKNE